MLPHLLQTNKIAVVISFSAKTVGSPIAIDFAITPWLLEAPYLGINTPWFPVHLEFEERVFQLQKNQQRSNDRPSNNRSLTVTAVQLLTRQMRPAVFVLWLQTWSSQDSLGLSAIQYCNML
jgi:hypothetical protein